MIKEYFGLSLKENFIAWTTLTCVLAVAGLLTVMVMAMFV